MRPNRVALAVWILWMIACAASGAILLVVKTGPQKYQASEFLAAVLVFSYLACLLLFGIEAEKARRILTQVLTGTPTPP